MPQTERVIYQPMPVRQSTFRGGLLSPVHRWFRLTPSFGPELVDRMLAEMDTKPQHTLLDPFSGAGTSLIQAKLNGLRSYGFEINPFLHFVCSTSTRVVGNASSLRRSFAAIGSVFHQRRKQAVGLELEELAIPLPQIHNVFRWWRRDVLKDLLLLRESIDAETAERSERDFFRLALAAVLIPDLTNVTLSRLQLHFVDKSAERIDVWSSFEAQAERMLADIESIDPQAMQTPATVFLTDSTQLDGVRIEEQIDRVITSPPYPNRYSYVWNTRPYLYFFGFMDTSKAAAQLDQRTIGGTWGSATSMLAKDRIEPENEAVARVVSPVAEEIRVRDGLMANYVMKYFNLIARQILAQDALLSDSAKLAYVVGCSRIKGVYVESDRLLAELFEQLDRGYRIERIERFRHRNSGRNLYESIVYASK